MKKTVIFTFITLFAFKLFLLFLDYYGNNSPELKAAILKYFTQADIAKGESYSRAGFGMYLVKSIIFAFMILILSFSPFAKKIELFCARLSKNRLFLTSMLFIAVLYTLITLISLPFNFYFSYITEHRFGFSNMTVGFWLWTRLKSYLLVLAFISLIGSAAIMLIRKLRFYSVFIIPAGGLIIGLVMIIIYPLVILPLFYEIKSIDNPGLEKQIIEAAQKFGVSVDKIYVIKESDYSKHTNAFFVGFGNNKRIYLYDTLLQNNNESEIISILTHETGHWVYNHNIKGVLIGFFSSLLIFIITYYFVKKFLLESGLPLTEMHSPSLIPLYLLFYIIFSGFTKPAEMVISRMMEAQADYYALSITRDPDAFISSEIKIARDNSSRLNDHPLPAFFWNSHPASIDRIKMAEKFKKLME